MAPPPDPKKMLKRRRKRKDGQAPAPEAGSEAGPSRPPSRSRPPSAKGGRSKHKLPKPPHHPRAGVRPKSRPPTAVGARKPKVKLPADSTQDQALPGLEGVDEVAIPSEPSEGEDEKAHPKQKVTTPPYVKKKESSEQMICVDAKKEQLYDLSRIPVPVRLNATRKTGLDYIYDGIPKPVGYLPDKQMPGWFDYPLDKLLPTVPAPKEYLYFSRGAVGQKLHRPNLHYTVYDPNNKELVVANPYSPLNDYHAKKYYQKPKIHDQLVNNDLVSKTNKAICSTKAFNKYRQYLFRRIFTEDVKDVIHDKDSHQVALQKMVLDARQEKEATEGKSFITKQRIQAALNLRKKKMMDRLLLGIEQQKATTQHSERVMKEKQHIADERRTVRIEQEKIRIHKLQEMERRLVEARATLIKDISAGDKANSDRRMHDKGLIKRAFKQFQLEWMDAKWEYQKIMLAKQKLVNHTVDYNMITNAQIRQDKVERLRAHMPQIIERRKAEYKRLWDVVRKFFNRWRDNVRKRKERRPDAMHKSNWEIPEVLDKTVEYLRLESGYEKLDDFIMGIVALKKRIKAELDAEEKAEAAEAAAAAAAEAELLNSTTSVDAKANSKGSVHHEEGGVQGQAHAQAPRASTVAALEPAPASAPPASPMQK